MVPKQRKWLHFFSFFFSFSLLQPFQTHYYLINKNSPNCIFSFLLSFCFPGQSWLLFSFAFLGHCLFFFCFFFLCFFFLGGGGGMGTTLICFVFLLFFFWFNKTWFFFLTLFLIFNKFGWLLLLFSCLSLLFCFFFFFESLTYGVRSYLLMIVLYYQIKTPISFWCKRWLNSQISVLIGHHFLTCIYE